MSEEQEEITDCPVCGVNGYRHRPDCRNQAYMRSVLGHVAVLFDMHVLHDGEDVRKMIP